MVTESEHLQNEKRSSQSLQPETMLTHDLLASSDLDEPLQAQNDESEKVSEEAEYMSGFKLWLMLLSLVFSIFLISLDIVSLPLTSSTCFYLTGFLRPLLLQQSPLLRISFMALKIKRGTAQSIS